MGKSHRFWRVTTVRGGTRCPYGDLAAGPRCILACWFAPGLNHTRCDQAQHGGAGGGQPGDKPALFLKRSSRLGFSCFDLERWEMGLSWLLSRHRWGETKWWGVEGM